MSKIQFKLVNGEPVCAGPDCPAWPYASSGCMLHVPTGSVCVSGTRQQRDEARAELEAIRAALEHEGINTYERAQTRDAVDALERLSARAEAEVKRLEAKGMVSAPGAIVVVPEEEGGFSAEIPSLPGCMTCAETWEEVWIMIQDAKACWLEARSALTEKED